MARGSIRIFVGGKWVPLAHATRERISPFSSSTAAVAAAPIVAQTHRHAEKGIRKKV